MSADKFYPYRDQQEWVDDWATVLVRGLGRRLTEQEMRYVAWLTSLDSETNGVFLDMFKEIIEKEELK